MKISVTQKLEICGQKISQIRKFLVDSGRCSFKLDLLRFCGFDCVLHETKIRVFTCLGFLHITITPPRRFQTQWFKTHNTTDMVTPASQQFYGRGKVNQMLVVLPFENLDLDNEKELKCCLHPTDGLRRHGFTAAFDGKALLDNLHLTYKGKSF